MPRATATSLTVLLLASPVLGQTPAAPQDPEAERASFQFADSNLVAELVAAEPLVTSPVALAWDAEERLYLAEMRDYPSSADGGAIRRLEDRDRDGRYETATVFADRLPFPNSVLPWNGGVLVTAAPDLWFLRDTDGDGIADERRVLFTGFGTGNPQLRANGLFWGLDGWVYGANGRSDGEIRRAYNPMEVTAQPPHQSRPVTTNVVSLRGRDFRFRPDTGEFESLAGRSQFGHARDDWGNRFLSWNTIPLRHEVFPDRFLVRQPTLAALEVLQDCLPAGDHGEVFSLTPPPLVFNNESGSHFNALSGLHVFRGDALGSTYEGNAFVGESLRNLIHHRVLVPQGPSFQGERREVGREFLASTDPWFHPVNFATGPDGALYVADFYRQFVEHPDWVAREMRDRVRWETGREHGRIWRIRRTDLGRETQRGTLAGLTTRELVTELASPNGWRRENAQRLLHERKDLTAAPFLRQAVRSAGSPRARSAALHTLDFLGLMDTDRLVEALGDSDSHVRAVAARRAGSRLAQAEAATNRLTRTLVALVEDGDERVQLEAALALGSSPNAVEREAALEKLGAGSTNRWLVLAAAMGTTNTGAAWFAKAKPSSGPNRLLPEPRDADPDRKQAVEAFRPALQLAGDRRRGAILCARLCLACHYLQGHGQRVGPDLGGLSSRPVETLLIDLIDPSQQVAPDYQTYEIVTTNDVRITGLLASESETRLTLRQPGSPDVSVARSQVRELRSTGRSLMPDGLEAGLSLADLADLLAFLQAPDGDLLPQ